MVTLHIKGFCYGKTDCLPQEEELERHTSPETFDQISSETAEDISSNLIKTSQLVAHRVFGPELVKKKKNKKYAEHSTVIRQEFYVIK